MPTFVVLGNRQQEFHHCTTIPFIQFNRSICLSSVSVFGAQSFSSSLRQLGLVHQRPASLTSRWHWHADRRCNNWNRRRIGRWQGASSHRVKNALSLTRLLSFGVLTFVQQQTTLARRLFEELGGADEVCYLYHDSYYKDISHKTFEERAKTNFDHPDSLETDLLLRHLQELKAGDACQVPTYDFATHSRTDVCIDMQPKRIIIVEGILLFTHAPLAKEIDVKVFVVRPRQEWYLRIERTYIWLSIFTSHTQDADSDIRLMRRIVRDTQERGRTVEEVLDQYHATVRPMHDEWVVRRNLRMAI